MVDAMRGIQSWQAVTRDRTICRIPNETFAFLYFASFYQPIYMLRASCLTLEIKIEAKIEESEKAGRCQETKPGHLRLEVPV